MDWETAVDLYLLEHEANGRSPRTLAWHRHTLGQVRAFLNWCADPDQGILDRNPARKLKVAQPRPLPAPFTDEELAALWKVVAQRPGRAGVRAGELCGIDPEDFDWGRCMVAVDGKTGPHIVAFSPKTAALLRKWAAMRAPKCPAFFQTSRGERWLPNSLLHWAWRLADRAGVKDAHPHRFRATYATKAAATGNLFAVQQQLGHSTLDMTRRYAEVTAQTLRQNHDATSPMNALLSWSGDWPRKKTA